MYKLYDITLLIYTTDLGIHRFLVPAGSLRTEGGLYVHYVVVCCLSDVIQLD